MSEDKGLVPSIVLGTRSFADSEGTWGNSTVLLPGLVVRTVWWDNRGRDEVEGDESPNTSYGPGCYRLFAPYAGMFGGGGGYTAEVAGPGAEEAAEEAAGIVIRLLLFKGEEVAREYLTPVLGEEKAANLAAEYGRCQPARDLPWGGEEVPAAEWQGFSRWYFSKYCREEAAGVTYNDAGRLVARLGDLQAAAAVLEGWPHHLWYDGRVQHLSGVGREKDHPDQVVAARLTGLYGEARETLAAVRERIREVRRQLVELAARERGTYEAALEAAVAAIMAARSIVPAEMEEEE